MTCNPILVIFYDPRLWSQIKSLTLLRKNMSHSISQIVYINGRWAFIKKIPKSSKPFFSRICFSTLHILIWIFLLFKIIIGINQKKKNRICKNCDSRDHGGPPHVTLQPPAAPTALCKPQQSPHGPLQPLAAFRSAPWPIAIVWSRCKKRNGWESNLRKKNPTSRKSPMLTIKQRLRYCVTVDRKQNLLFLNN
jgi:hypothetical protein